MTVEEAIDKVNKINDYVDEFDAVNCDGMHLAVEDAVNLRYILTDYRDMLLAMKVKTN